jgi:16S rRNA (cytosine1402-N4)-methyltransferase
MHIPVLLSETLDLLAIQPDRWYLDGTFGRGGHTRAILKQGGKVVACDMDVEAIESAHANFSKEIEDGKLQVYYTNFSHLDSTLREQGFVTGMFAGALFDLGLSSNQIDESQRGFSFQGSQPLDMRMDPRLGVTAADLLNALPEKHLKNLLWEYSQETQASQIAHAVAEARAKEPLRTTDQLVKIIQKVKGNQRDRHIHPATKTFMALRMAVNTEIDNLAEMLNTILPWLESGGRLAIISFHEGEDRLVKQTFRQWGSENKVSQITDKPVMASEQETNQNPRSRSARLRVCRKI